MAYIATNWQTGDTITAEKLNNAENGIVNSEWKTESSTQLFSESVTTTAGGEGNMGMLAYSDQITADILVVTFDGTEYICNKIVMNGFIYYGGMGDNGLDFSEYPFLIASSERHGNAIYTETTGTYSASATGITITPTVAFTVAVNTVVNSIAKPPFECVSGTTTRNEIDAALGEHRLLYFYSNSGMLYILTGLGSSSVDYIKSESASAVTTSFIHGVFTVTE